MDAGGLCRLHGARGGRAGDGVGVGVGAGGGRRDSLRRWVSAYAGLHGVVNGSLVLLDILLIQVVIWESGSGLPRRHVQVYFHIAIRTQGIQRRGDGKDCTPLPPKEWGVMRARLAIFFLDLGLGEVSAPGDAWNLLSEGKGVGGTGWTVQPKGLAPVRQSVLISCTRVGAHGQTCVSYTWSAPQPPQPPHP